MLHTFSTTFLSLFSVVLDVSTHILHMEVEQKGFCPFQSLIRFPMQRSGYMMTKGLGVVHFFHLYWMGNPCEKDVLDLYLYPLKLDIPIEQTYDGLHFVGVLCKKMNI